MFLSYFVLGALAIATVALVWATWFALTPTGKAALVCVVLVAAAVGVLGARALVLESECPYDPGCAERGACLGTGCER